MICIQRKRNKIFITGATVRINIPNKWIVKQKLAYPRIITIKDHNKDILYHKY